MRGPRADYRWVHVRPQRAPGGLEVGALVGGGDERVGKTYLQMIAVGAPAVMGRGAIDDDAGAVIVAQAFDAAVDASPTVRAAAVALSIVSATSRYPHRENETPLRAELTPLRRCLQVMHLRGRLAGAPLMVRKCRVEGAPLAAGTLKLSGRRSATMSIMALSR